MNMFGYNEKASVDVKNLLSWMIISDGRLLIHSERTICLKCDVSPSLVKGESFCVDEILNITPVAGEIEIILS